MTSRPRPLAALPVARLEALYDAAADALAALDRMAARGENPVTAALAGAEAVDEWTHYPDGDARDRAGRSRYYYHVHSPDELGAGEHGHFHVFLEPRAGQPDDAPAHVVGLAMDANGRLLRLFSTNGWVTGETWRAAGEISAALDAFTVESAQAGADLDRWISSVVRFYAPEIAAMLDERDAALKRMRARDPGSDPLEDRSVRLLAECEVSFLDDIAGIEQALDAAR